MSNTILTTGALGADKARRHTRLGCDPLRHRPPQASLLIAELLYRSDAASDGEQREPRSPRSRVDDSSAYERPGRAS